MVRLNLGRDRRLTAASTSLRQGGLIAESCMQSKPISMSASSGGLVGIPCRYTVRRLQSEGVLDAEMRWLTKRRTIAKPAPCVLTVSCRGREMRLLCLPKAFTLGKSFIAGSAAEPAMKSTQLLGPIVQRTQISLANSNLVVEATIMSPGRLASGISWSSESPQSDKGIANV